MKTLNCLTSIKYINFMSPHLQIKATKNMYLILTNGKLSSMFGPSYTEVSMTL